MLDLKQYSCLGEALRAALDRWPDEVCLIEADRDRERARLTFAQFKAIALPLAAGLERAGFAAGDRAHGSQQVAGNGIFQQVAAGARAQDLAHQVEAARRSDQLRTTLRSS